VTPQRVFMRMPLSTFAATRVHRERPNFELGVPSDLGHERMTAWPDEHSTIGETFQIYGHLRTTPGDSETTVLPAGEPAAHVSGVKTGWNVQYESRLGPRTEVITAEHQWLRGPCNITPRAFQSPPRPIKVKSELDFDTIVGPERPLGSVEIAVGWQGNRRTGRCWFDVQF